MRASSLYDLTYSLFALPLAIFSTVALANFESCVSHSLVSHSLVSQSFSFRSSPARGAPVRLCATANVLATSTDPSLVPAFPLPPNRADSPANSPPTAQFPKAFDPCPFPLPRFRSTSAPPPAVRAPPPTPPVFRTRKFHNAPPFAPPRSTPRHLPPPQST